MKTLFLLTVLTFLPCMAMEKESTWDAELYDKHSMPQYQASLKNLEKFDLSSPQFQTIVELGCNTANVSSTLAERHSDKTFVGIDPEIDAIKLGVERNTNKNLLLICDSAQKYNLERHNIPPADLVVRHNVLHWIAPEEQQCVFNNIAANVAARGVVDISTSAKQGDTSLTKAILWTILKPKWWGYLPYCISQVFIGQKALTLLSALELRQLATQAGLLVATCEEKEVCSSFDSKEEFVPWLTSILKPYGIDTLFANKEHQKEFVNDIVELYCQHYNPATNGTIEYRFKQLHLTACKPACDDNEI